MHAFRAQCDSGSVDGLFELSPTTSELVIGYIVLKELYGNVSVDACESLIVM